MNRQICLIGMFVLVLIGCAEPDSNEQKVEIQNKDQVQVYSLTGQPLIASPPNEKVLKKYALHKMNFEADTLNVEKLIWYGRFAAYKGSYQEAIEIYSNGIKNFPNDTRLYRHRGHRYISIRKLDEAIRDFEHAATLIKGSKNEIEPDGMPNEQNIPVSTLHGNIWYHLGLAYYLKHDFENALRAYKNCIASSTNHDNIVSSTHWLYMISRRLGDENMANGFLNVIQDSMAIIENFNYHDACKFYKGSITLQELQPKESETAGSDAVRYGIGNWHLYNGQIDEAKIIFQEILNGKSWSSFGYLAAESDLVFLNNSSTTK